MNNGINRTAFNSYLSMFTKVNQQTLDRIGGSLRKKGMVSVGGRGPNAPQITPEDAKNIILGLLGSDNASKAADAVKKLSNLKSPETGRRAGDAITLLFTNPDYRFNLTEIHVTRNFPKVALYWGFIDKPDTIREEVFSDANDHGDHGNLKIVAQLDGVVIREILRLSKWTTDVTDYYLANRVEQVQE
jgi:hypothetical protein